MIVHLDRTAVLGVSRGAMDRGTKTLSPSGVRCTEGIRATIRSADGLGREMCKNGISELTNPTEYGWLTSPNRVLSTDCDAETP